MSERTFELANGKQVTESWMEERGLWRDDPDDATQQMGAVMSHDPITGEEQFYILHRPKPAIN